MAYCKQCGAYIPDGQTACLACGFDEAAKPNSSAASATAQAQRSAEDTERLRRQMEEQRARQQEKSRLWAEQETARRKAQEEARQAQNAARRNANIPYSSDGDRTTFNGGMGSSASSTGSSSFSNSKTMAILSYLSALCFIPLFACKNDDFAMFHAKQGLALFIFTSIGNIVGSFLGFGWVFTVAQIYFMFKGISNANAGKKEPLPFIGNFLKL